MRLLGLDVGSRWIGFATGSDVDGVATPSRTLPRRGGEADLEAVAALASEVGAEGLVLGLPIELSGAEGVAAGRVRRLGEQLRRYVALPVYYWDERFTTVEAERVLIEAGLKRKRRKEAVDRVAAVLILQGFLDAKRSSLADGVLGLGPK